MRKIGIIGGGFSGTMTAVNLARFSEDPLHVTIINAKRPFGRGTAYATHCPEHLLNVAARNMSAFPDHPTHFVDWLRTRCEYRLVPEQELREMFAPRQVYGDYLRSLAEIYLHPVDARSSFELRAIDDEAVDIIVNEEGGGNIALASGASVEVDQILLATGNQPPAAFPSSAPLSRDPRYCADPWEDWESRIPSTDQRIVLLGTGLTMVDVLVTLAKRGWDGNVTAISRNGMMPMPHFRGIAYPDFVPKDESLDLTGLVTLVKQHADQLKKMAQHPAIAIDKLRPHTQRLWKNLTVDEKREFLKDYVANWNRLRHRIAQSIHSRVTDAFDEGRLDLVSGTIESLAPNEQDIEVHYVDVDGQSATIAGDLVINCTGPRSRFSQAGVPLFNELLEKGLVRSDELDMGIEVDEDFSVIAADGSTSTFIHAIGPLLKGSLWETTAVPELRGQTMHVARAMLNQDTATPQEYVIEYCI
jgi:uncharacterized NAD(P)/FAD-binding protein YdhS